MWTNFVECFPSSLLADLPLPLAQWSLNNRPLLSGKLIPGTNEAYHSTGEFAISIVDVPQNFATQPYLLGNPGTQPTEAAECGNGWAVHMLVEIGEGDNKLHCRKVSFFHVGGGVCRGSRTPGYRLATTALTHKLSGLFKVPECSVILPHI